MERRGQPNIHGQIVLDIIKKFNRPVTATDILQRLELGTGQRLKGFRPQLMAALEGGVRYGYLNKKARRYFLRTDNPNKLPRNLVEKSLTVLNVPTKFNLLIHAKKPWAERMRAELPKTRRSKSANPVPLSDSRARSLAGRRSSNRTNNDDSTEDEYEGPPLKEAAIRKGCDVIL